MKTIPQKELEEAVLRLFDEVGRPVHIGDLKKEFGIVTKRDSAKKTFTETDSISRGLYYLFASGKISKSRNLAKVRKYPASPYAKGKFLRTVNVRLYAPRKYIGKNIAFELNGEKYDLLFVNRRLSGRKRTRVTKVGAVRELLQGSERALTTNEILEEINRKHDLYDVSTKKKFYNATTSLLHGALNKLRREGLRARKCDGKWLWFYRKGQFERFVEHYQKDDLVLRTVKDMVKSDRCVPLTKVCSVLQATPSEVKYRVNKAGKFVPVKVKVATTLKETKVEIEVSGFKRDSMLPWLGVVTPRSEHGYGYETMLVDLDADWEEELKIQIRKSLSRIHVRTLVGFFYEKLVAKLFNIICTSEELRQDPELSKYAIPFVFRGERLVNVWTTMEGGRKAEFDVLIRGTFHAFDTIAKGKTFLDLVMPIESKYTVVSTEHITHFDEKIRKTFDSARNVIPMVFGLSFNQEALTLARRFGIMTVYFSSVDNLVSKLTGKDYSYRSEWKRVEERLNSGELTLEELRRQMNSLEFKYLFEEDIEERIGSIKTKPLKEPPKTERELMEKAPKRIETKAEAMIKPMLARPAERIEEVLTISPLIAWEYKLDGIRLLADKKNGEVKLYSRNGNDLTERFPEVCDKISKGFDGDVLLDGELVAVGIDNSPLPPQTLKKQTKDFEARYILFDILREGGDNLRNYSYEERRRILEKASENSGIETVPRVVTTSGDEVKGFFREARAKGHEGLVAKDVASIYTAGRGTSWFKYKGRADTLDLVVVGYSPGNGKRTGEIGSLLLAAKENGNFLAVGKVGTGFKKADSEALGRLLREHRLDSKPDHVVSAQAPAYWVEPQIVVEVRHERITRSRKYSSGHSLRFPRFVRVREDKGTEDAASLEELASSRS